RADGWQLVLLGEGEVPVRDMLGLLSAGGYQGWVSVEWEKRWHPEIAEPEVALPQHLAVLGTWMREAAEEKLGRGRWCDCRTFGVMTSQSEKAARFLDLHRKGNPLLLPNPWDQGSARVLAALGFQALATTSS